MLQRRKNNHPSGSFQTLINISDNRLIARDYQSSRSHPEIQVEDGPPQRAASMFA